MSNKKFELLDEISDIFEANGFFVTDVSKQGYEYYIEYSQSTPLGEDWIETLFIGDGSMCELYSALDDRVYGFDCDEEVEPYIEMRGKNGVPDSIKALIEDAEWKEGKLTALRDSFDEYGSRQMSVVNIELIVAKETLLNAIDKSDFEYKCIETIGEGTEEQFSLYLNLPSEDTVVSIPFGSGTAKELIESIEYTINDIKNTDIKAALSSLAKEISNCEKGNLYEVTTVKEQYEKARAFLEHEAETNNEQFYEIVEDDYVYENGLALICYEDEKLRVQKLTITAVDMNAHIEDMREHIKEKTIDITEIERD